MSERRGRQRNPFQGVTDVFSEMNRLREIGRTGQDPAGEAGERSFASAWVPAADIFADGIDLVVQVELAGVEPDDVDVALSGGVLTISGVRASRTAVSDESYYARERPQGAFRRSIGLPAGISEGDISATFDNGLLEVLVRGACSTVPEPRRIQVRSKSG